MNDDFNYSDYDNIKVIYRENLSPWVCGAKVLIQNGCTSAIESVVRGIPVISYGPAGFKNKLGVPNLLGIQAKNSKELHSIVDQILSEDVWSEEVTSLKNNNMLKDIISINEDLASMKIIKIMESVTSINNKNKISVTSIIFMWIVRNIKSVIDSIRVTRVQSTHDDDKNLKKELILNRVEDISKSLAVKTPKVTIISKRTILIN